MQEQIYEIVIEKDDITWRDILFNLVKEEGMDPWNINITTLTQKFIDLIKEMQEHDMKISGKVLLAAAYLLRIKSTHLVDHDISKLDALINEPEEYEDDFEDDGFYAGEERQHRKPHEYTLIPRNPQPRSRKVSIHDLVQALQRAMESKRRKIAKDKPVKFTLLPENHVDIFEVIQELYNKITYYAKKDPKKKLTFASLLPPRAGRMEKVYTFIPLLHLENEHKVSTSQEESFGEIVVNIVKQKKSSKAKSSQ